MKNTNWKGIAELIGISAIVASLIFVGVELRQSRAIAISEGNLSNAEIQIASNNAINEHSSIWVRGNNGEDLAEQETVVFSNLVRNKAVHAFMEYARLDQLEFDVAADEMTALFSVFLFENPGARQTWIQHEEFLEQHFDVSAAHRTWKEKVRANLIRLDGEAAR